MKIRALIKWPEGTAEHQKAHAWRHVRILDAAIKVCGERKRTAVQAGGNIGLWPLRLAKYFQRVITFEPEPYSFDCLTANVKSLGIECHRKALGAVPMLCGIERRSLGSHRIIQGVSVQMIPLDSLQLRDVDLLQLDIEGTEHAALMGAQLTVTRCRPVVMLELLSSAAEKACAEFLRGHSYKLHRCFERDCIFVPQ